MKIAKKHNLFVIEDACQGVGGGYKGRKLGTIGDIGAYSFNYYKNMTCGEGGAFVTSDPNLAERAKCAIDPCHFYWNGKAGGLEPFSSNGARASELQGAMLNVQLDRIDEIIGKMREEKKRILAGTAGLGNLGLHPSPIHSPDHDCAAHVMYLMPSAQQADRFVEVFPTVIAGKTGRHTYTEWDHVLRGAGAAHPAMNPYNHPHNAECRKTYSKDICARSLEILNRTVMIPTDPEHDDAEIGAIVHNIGVAAAVAAGEIAADDANIKRTTELDPAKFDSKGFEKSNNI